MKKHLVSLLVLFLLVSVMPFIHGEPLSDTAGDSLSVQEDYYQYMTDWSVHLTNQTISEENIGPFYNNMESNDDTEPIPLSGPMDSAWPMVLHDAHHTAQSLLNTTNNHGAELWRIHGNKAGAVESSAVIDRNGTIYFGTMGSDGSLYALYPNGTVKWRYAIMGASLIWSTPAIAEDGTIYVPTWGGYPPYFYALYPNGTLKWTFGLYTTSSPAISNDGTIYIGDDNKYFYAINPDGTEKWRYTTGNFIQSSPAIADDGTIYVGSADTYLYAFYPNGTLRWRYKTGGWIKSDPSIGGDGTIYAPAFDGNLYAINPNGTLKWSTDAGNEVIPRAVAIATDGTLYVGTEALRAFYPNNGTIKWSCVIGGQMYGTFPAISADGTIYVSAGGSIVAINPDGTERWRKQLTIAQIQSSPSIGPDDRVYVGSEQYGVGPYGYLHAFGLGPLRADAGGPYQGTALRPTTLTGLAFGGKPPYQYLWDFGDGNTSTEIDPIHIYTSAGNYTATFTITDGDGNISMDTTMVTIDYPLPTLTINKPTNGFYIADKKIFPFPFPFILGKITIKVDVDSHYSIKEVIFCVSDYTKYDTTAPYEWTWTQRNFQLKNNIYVIAYDVKGRYAEQRIEVTKLF